MSLSSFRVIRSFSLSRLALVAVKDPAKEAKEKRDVEKWNQAIREKQAAKEAALKQQEAAQKPKGWTDLGVTPEKPRLDSDQKKEEKSMADMSATGLSKEMIALAIGGSILIYGIYRWTQGSPTEKRPK